MCRRPQIEAHSLLTLLSLLLLMGCAQEAPVTLRFEVSSNDPATVAATERVLMSRLREFPTSMLSSMTSSAQGSIITVDFKYGVPEPQVIDYLCRTRGQVRATLEGGGSSWFTDRDITDSVSTYQDGAAQLSIQLTPEAGTRVLRLSSANLDRTLHLSLDRELLIAAPISGSFSQSFMFPFPAAYANRRSELMSVLLSGPLPAKVSLLTPLEERPR